MAEVDAVLGVKGAPSGYSDRATLVARRIEAGDCLVSENDGVVVGFLTMYRRSFFGRDFVELLAVDEGHRREGIASGLLRASIHAATTSQLFTSTNSSNQPMLDLLRNEQWLFSGELVGLDVDDPELVFYKDLAP
ncbi:MAG TPA: GNAT family N-acetyltransferase [Acidimicrobiales bacterium]|jgi:GNAT superfamily N-acetyltransferase|nr:GNAT family N-acetyltransferase [Acidimicrobiales bacterium]